MLVKLALISLMTLSFSAKADSTPDVNAWVLEAVDEMPKAGGYKLTSASVKSMMSGFSWNTQDQLLLNANKAVPSYCTTGTYLVFYKVLEKYWKWSKTQEHRSVLEILSPNLEHDGVRMWGRWNSNGPGTAKVFHDLKLGKNFDKLSDARPGDFLKIFWNDQVGKNERGHTVIFIDSFDLAGSRMIRFWGSNASTNGFGLKVVAPSEYSRLLFSRLETPENIRDLSTLPQKDDFLASMLSRVSNWDEVRDVSGF